MPDKHSNFGFSWVASAPAAGSTSLAVQTGDGAAFPVPPFNCTVWPTGNVQPLTGNAEIIRVTGISTDTFGFIRTAEGSTLRAIAVGDQIAETISVKTLVDAERNTPTQRVLRNSLFR